MKAHTPWVDPLHCISAFIPSELPFHCVPLRLFCLSLQSETLSSASAVIDFYVNWDRSGDQQITSAWFFLIPSQTHEYRCKNTLTRMPLCLPHTHTVTFTRARLDRCHGSLPNEDWDDSWNSDIIMHHSGGPRKLFNLKRGEKNLVDSSVSDRDS